MTMADILDHLRYATLAARIRANDPRICTSARRGFLNVELLTPTKGGRFLVEVIAGPMSANDAIKYLDQMCA